MEKPWKVIVAFVGVFIAGSVFGGLLALRIAAKRDQSQHSPAVTAVAPPVTAPTTTPATTTPVTASGSAVAATSSVTQPTQTTPPQQGGGRQNPKSEIPQVQLPAAMVVQAPQLMRRYVDRLDLTPEQKERIHPLIVRATNDLSRQKQNNLRETGIIIQHLQEDLAKELTVAQRGRLEEMAEHQRQIIEAREKAQQEKIKANQPVAKPMPKDAPKVKSPSGKPVDDGN